MSHGWISERWQELDSETLAIEESVFWKLNDAIKPRGLAVAWLPYVRHKEPMNGQLFDDVGHGHTRMKSAAVLVVLTCAAKKTLPTQDEKIKENFCGIIFQKLAKN